MVEQTHKQGRMFVKLQRMKNAIIVASYGTFSTGINIRNFTMSSSVHPQKSRIRVLQSIGRGLRQPMIKLVLPF